MLKIVNFLITFYTCIKVTPNSRIFNWLLSPIRNFRIGYQDTICLYGLPIPNSSFSDKILVYSDFCVLNSDPYTASIRCTDSKISVVVLYKRFNFRKSNFIASNSTRIFKGRYLYRSDLAYSCCKVNMVSQCKGRRFIVVPDQPASPLQSALPYLTRGGNPMRFLSVWVTPPPLPCFTVIPIACVLFTQRLGVIVRDEDRACCISSLHAASIKTGLFRHLPLA